MEAHGIDPNRVIDLLRQQAHNLMDEHVYMAARIMDLEEQLAQARAEIEEKNDGNEEE